MKADEIDVRAAAVLCHREEIADALEAAVARERGGDVVPGDRLDRIYFDLPILHPVSPACGDAGLVPDANAGGDRAGTDGLAEVLHEEHAGRV